MILWTEIERKKLPLSQSELFLQVSDWLNATDHLLMSDQNWLEAVESLGFNPIRAIQSPLLQDCAVAWPLYCGVADEFEVNRNVVVSTKGGTVDGRWLSIIKAYPRPVSLRPLRSFAQGMAVGFLRKAICYRDRKRLFSSINTVRSSGAEVSLFIPRENSHFSLLDPIANAVVDNGKIGVVYGVFSEAHAVRAARNRTGVLSLWGGRIDARIQKAVLCAGNVLKQLEGIVASDLPQDFQRYLIALVRNLWWEWGRALGELATTFNKFVAEFQPRFVFLGNPNTKEGRVLCSLARRKGIPSVSIQHGSIVPTSPDWRNCPVDRLFVWGETSKHLLSRTAYPTERVFVSGSPKVELGRECFAASKSIRGSEVQVLVASSGRGHQVDTRSYRMFIDWLQELIETSRDIRWVIRLHPKERSDEFSWTKNLASVEIEESRPDSAGLAIYDTLGRSDAMITILSAATLDAMTVGVPVLAFRPPDMEAYLKNVSFLNAGATHNVSTIREGKEFLSSLVDKRLDDAVAISATRMVEHELGSHLFPSRSIAKKLEVFAFPSC